MEGKATARRRRWAIMVGGVSGLVAVGAVTGLALTVLKAPSPESESSLLPTSGLPAGPQPAGLGQERPERWVPRRSEIEAARRYADAREGTVAFAVVTSRGEVHGLKRNRIFPSASLVKVMLLLAYLDRLDATGKPLSAEGRSLLAPMIEVSDNLAASQAYGLVGPDGLEEVARRAGMKRFVAAPAWGDSSVTAGDIARLFTRVDRLVETSRRDYLRQLLSRITPDQSWGIPAVTGDAWNTLFKGGWRPTAAGQLVHQAALLKRRGSRVGLAVLSDGNPSFDYGVGTIEGVTCRLMSGKGGRAKAGGGPNCPH